MCDLQPLPSQIIGELVGAALSEDWGRLGDITSAAVIEPDASARGVIRAREEGVLAGLGFAQTAFTLADKRLKLVGPVELTRNVSQWIKPSIFEGIPPAEEIHTNMMGAGI